MNELRGIAEVIPQPVVVVAPCGEIVVANAAARALSPALAVGARLQDAVTEPGELASRLRLWLGYGSPVPGRLSLRGTDGPLERQLRVVRIDADGGPLLLLHVEERSQGPFAQLNDRLDGLQREVRYRREAQRQREAALDAERAARRQLERLQHLYAALAGALTVADTVRTITTYAPTAVGACAAAVAVDVDQRGLTLVEGDPVPWLGAPADAVGGAAGRHPLRDAADDCRARFFPSPEALQAAYPRLRYVAGDDAFLAAAVPLCGAGERKALGVLAFATRTRAQLDPDLAAVVAGQCAQALERARLHDVLERAYARERFLGQASQLLAESLEYARVLRRVARAAVPAVADACVVHLLDDQGELEPVAAAHAEVRGQELLEELVLRNPSAQSQELRRVGAGGEPLVLHTAGERLLADAGTDAEQRRELAELGVTSAVAVPLRSHDRTLGTLTVLMTGDKRALDDADLPLLRDLAARAALAIDNARVHEEHAKLAEQLQQALGSRVLIEQAKGVLAGRLGTSPEEAFDMLRGIARSGGRKLRDVAADVVRDAGG